MEEGFKNYIRYRKKKSLVTIHDSLWRNEALGIRKIRWDEKREKLDQISSIVIKLRWDLRFDHC